MLFEQTATRKVQF